MKNLNDVVEFLITTTYRNLKEKTGRVPGFDKVILIIRLIVLNNYESCLTALLENDEEILK